MTIANQDDIRHARTLLDGHALYGAINAMDELRVFMEGHVFAVWDFMSLVKRLQREVTCVTLPWQPPRHEDAARLINDIVLSEESDLDHNGKPASHMTMYLNAMREVGADTRPFEVLANAIAEGSSLDHALLIAGVAPHVAQFVTGNIAIATQGSDVEVAANFLFGREDIIPTMFLSLLDKWGIAENDAPALVYYMKRHIELDGDEHGPAGHKLLDGLIGGCPDKQAKAHAAALAAINARIALWDGIYSQLSQPVPQRRATGTSL